MSPVNTTRDTDSAEFLLELSNDILEFREKGKVIVMGDLNSRVGDLPSGFFVNGQHYEFSRKSADVNISKSARRQGRRLAESMNANKMIILNGVDGGGDYTCVHKNKGVSMIDFIILSYDLILYNPEIDLEEEEGRDHKHKIRHQKQPLNLLDPKEPKPNKIVYRRQSIKVWTEYASAFSDHRLVTCIPERKHETEGEEKTDKKSQNKIVSKMNIPRWRRGKGATDPVWEKFRQEVKGGIREWEHTAEINDIEGKKDSELLSDDTIKKL